MIGGWASLTNRVGKGIKHLKKSSRLMSVSDVS